MGTNVSDNKQLATTTGASLQMMSIQDANSWYNDFVAFSKSIMKKDLDYGVIPGTPKPTLYKAGAEKLKFVYGIGVEMVCIDHLLDRDNPFVDYTYKCIARAKSGQIIAECEGNCNSAEPKFGWVWKTLNEMPEGTDITNLQSKTSGRKISEFAFSIEKAETGGQYGKPAEYWKMWEDAILSNRAKKIKKNSRKGQALDAWELDETVTMYRLPNPDVIGQKNTIMKMAQKRAFVGAILLATGASEFYTQDIEDMEINGQIFSNDAQTAEVVSTVINADPDKPATSATDTDSTNGAVQQPAPEEPIPGHWYAKLERCKTPDDVDQLALKHKETIIANPELRKLFNQFKAKIKSSNQ